jgi:hypothetical protein
MMPALPGTHLVFIHPDFTLAPLEAGFNARSRCDDPRQLHQRRLLHLQVFLSHTSRGQIVTITIVGILIAGIRRSLPRQRTLVREGTPRDHQPFVRPRPFPFQTSLHPACDHLDLHRAFFPVPHRHPGPPIRGKGVAPGAHRVPGGFRPSSTPVIRRQRRLQVAYAGGAGHPQHVAFAPLPQCLTKPRVAPQLIVTRYPQPCGTCSPHASSISRHCSCRV